MNLRFLGVVGVILVSVLGRVSLAADDQTYPLGDTAALKLKLPEGWTAENDAAPVPTIELKAPAEKQVSIQISAIPGDTTDAKIKSTAKAIGDRYAGGSVEKKTTLEEIKGPAVHGYVSTFTDPAPKPGEFKFVTAGLLACDKQALAVTVLCNDKAGADFKAAIEALKTFSVAAAPPSTQPAVLPIKSPDGKWTLDVPGKWQVMDDGKSRDGKMRQLSAMSADGNWMMTVFLEPAAKPQGNAVAARDFYLARMKKNPLGMDNLKQAAVGEVAYLEYDQGPADLKQHNLNAYLAHAGVWVDVHVSKVEFDEKTDRAALDAIIKGLKVEKPSEKK